ncbi:MAG: helix-turn-helix transcriptional regulator [Mediterraneibacter sp.]
MTINELLREEKISKYRLSRVSGVSYTTINDICTGKTRIEKCSAETIYKIAKVFSISMEELIKDAVEEVSESPGEFIEHILKDRKYMETYLYIRDEEKKSREILIEFTEEYPGAANGKNVEDILQVAHRKLQNKK